MSYFFLLYIYILCFKSICNLYYILWLVGVKKGLRSFLEAGEELFEFMLKPSLEISNISHPNYLSGH